MANEGEVKLNRKLNLVIKIESERGPLYVFSAPISRLMFDTHFLLIGRAYNSLYMNDFGAVGGPRMAARMIRQEAAMRQPEQAFALLDEIKRLTTVWAPRTNGGGSGYEQLPFDVAAQRKLIDEDDQDEIEGAICFFTLVLWMTPRADLGPHLKALERLWRAETTLLNAMDYIRSLPISMKDVDTGPSPIPQPAISQSSIPS
jgi:hypothetical protein